MKKITLLVLFLSTLWGYSQVKNYTFSQTTGAYTAISGGTQLGNETSDTQHFVDPAAPLGGTTPVTGVGFPIGFNFIYNGYSYDRFAVNTNGWISLGSSALTPAVNATVTNYNTPLSSTTAITPEALAVKICALGRDLQAQAGAGIQFKTIGEAPNQTLVVQWTNYKKNGTAGTGDSYNFQIRLNQSSNTIDFVYGTMTHVSATATTYMVGLRAEPSASTTNFVTRTSTTGWDNTTAGTTAHTVTMSNVIKPASGLTLTWTPAPCSVVKDLVVSDITANTATLNWGVNSPAPSAGYEYICSPSATPPTGSGTAVASPTATATDLTPNTRYNVFFRSACGDGIFTQWYNLGNFKTKCVASGAFTENFDSYPTGAGSMPDCWTTAGAGLAYINNGASSPFSGVNRLYMNNTATTVAYAIMPLVDNAHLGTYRLKFKAYATAASKKLDVGYFTDITNPSTFVSIQAIDMPSTAATAQEFAVYPANAVPAIPTDVKNLVFKTGTSGATTIYIDDIIWQLSPACTDLKNVSVKLPTSSSIKLSWDVTGTETSWQYAVSPSTVTDPTTLPETSIMNVDLASVTVDANFPNTRTFTVNNLMPSTSYKIWVRSKCGEGAYGYWSASPIFLTACTSVATIFENFDTTADGSLPSCWNKVGTQGIGKAAPVAGAPSGPNILVLNSASATTRAVVAMPPLSNTAEGTYRLRFKIRGSANNVPYEIGYVTDLYNDASFVSLQNLTTGLSSEYNTVVVTLGTAPLSQVLAFRNSGLISGGSSIYIDDLTWEPTTTCADASLVAAKLPTSTSVQLSWNVIGAESAWQYAVSSPTVTDPATIPSSAILDIDMNSVTATGANRTMTVNNLTPETSYKIWMRSKCGTGDYGYWASSQNFLMPCASVATIYEGFDTNLDVPTCWKKLETAGSISVVANQGSASSNALELKSSGNLALFPLLPPLNTAMGGGYRIKFKCKSLTAGSKLDIVCFTDLLYATNTNTVYNILKTITFSASNPEFAVSEILPANLITSPYLGFRYYYSSSATAYIDDFVWEFVPACPDVTAVAINGITGESVNLGWTSSGVENDWQYALTSAKEADPNTLTAKDFTASKNVTAVTSTISNLTPSTPYKFWIRSKCSPSSFGAWAGPYYFSTNCAAIDGFVQNFDASPDLPSCWTKVGTANALLVNQAGASSPNVLKIDGSTTSAATKGIVAMQPVSNSADGTHILRFKLSGSAVGAKVEVGYTTNVADPAKFISLNKVFTVSSTTAFSTESVELGFEPGSQVLAFRNPGTSTTNSSVYIDDVVWEPLPSCLDISTLVSTGITSTSVGLTWKKGGTEGSWQYAIGDSSVSDPKTLAAKSVVSPTVDDLDVSTTIGGLAPSTSYRVWVRSKCSSSSFGVWVGPYAFTTTCAPVDKFTERFDLNTNIPACWKQVGTAALTVTATPASAPNSLTLVSNATAKVVAAMPPVSNAGAGTHRLRFKFRSSVANSNIHIGYLENIADPSSFQLVEAISATAKDVFYSKSVNLGTNPTSEILAFKNPDNATIFIDDVYWEPLPICPDISAVAVAKATASSVDLGWSAGGSETEWQYAIGLTDTDPDLLTAVDFTAPVITGSSVVGTIGNLTASTSYKVWVRAKCTGISSFGIWTDVATFATSCVPATAFAQNFDAATSFPTCWSKVGAQGTADVRAVTGAPSGTNGLYLYSTSSATNKPIVAMPAVSNAAAGTHRLKFKFKCGGIGQTLEVGYLKVVNDPASFMPLKSFTSTTNTAFETATAELGTAPASEVLAFRNAGSATLAVTFYVDNVVWEPIPACSDVSGAVLGSVTSNTANIKWATGGTEVAWQYAVGASTSDDPNLLTAVDFVSPVITGSNISGNVIGLAPNASYKVWVRSNCGSGTFGAWSEVALPFTTPCVAIATLTEDFDATPTNGLPSCWKKVGTLGIGNVSIYGGAPSGANLLVINSASTTTRAVVAMPALSNTAAGTHRLRFKARGSANSVPFEVGYVTDLNNDASFFPLKNLTTGLMTEYNTTIVELGAGPLSQVLAFRNSGAISGGSSVYIDDVSWEPIPTCADANVAAKSPTADSVQLAWTVIGTETAWQYAISPSIVNDPAMLASSDIIDVDPNSVTVDGANRTLTIKNLTSNTSYKIWVRSKCSDGVYGYWSASNIFATPCSLVATLNENFDASTVLPSCWKKLNVNGTISIAPAMGTNSSNALKLVSQGASVAVWLGLPPLSTTTSGYKLKFKYKSDTAGTTFKIVSLSDPNNIIVNPNNFTDVATPTVAVANTEYTFDSVIAGATTPYIAFRIYYTSATPTTVYIDDLVWEAVAPASCATGITATPDAACGTYATAISWPAANSASGYRLTVGTTSGGSDLVNNKDLGNVLSYSVIGTANTTYYYTLKPYNSLGDATGCEEKSFATNANACYCTSVPATKDGTGITNVQIGAVKFVNPSVTYSDFTSKPVNLAQGVNTLMPISFNTGVFGYNTNVWIDFNDNKLFEASEIVYTGKSANTSPNTLTASFVLQPSAPLGMHRMRIGAAVAAQTPANPCYSGTLGVTLDFAVNIVAPIINDEPINATALTVGKDFPTNAVTGTNVDATGSNLTEPTCGNYSGSDVWFTATVPASGKITFEVNSVTDGITNTAAAAYNGPVTALTLIACDDSSSTTGKNVQGGDQPKILLTGRTPGEVLYFRVWENGGDAFGAYKVSAYDPAALGVEAFDVSNFSFYPNPVRDILNISLDKEITDVTIVNLLGQQVIAKSVNSNQVKIDMSGLTAGTYLVRVTSDNQSKTIKVVKE